VIAYCLEGAAGFAVAAGRPDRAARLLGAAEALLDSLGIPFQGEEEESYLKTLDAIAEALDEDSREAGRAAGRNEALDEIVAEALES